jgi:hypothetical protein
MGAPDIALTACFSVVAAANIAIGSAMLWRSRHKADAIQWRGQHLAAPRWAGRGHLFLGLTFGILALGDVLFEPGTAGGRLMLLAAMGSAVGTIVAGIMWFLRRGRAATYPPRS